MIKHECNKNFEIKLSLQYVLRTNKVLDALNHFLNC
jgi:hypothetical protein